MSTFDQTSWADPGYAREYLDNANHYIPERQQLFEVLRSFYRRFVAQRTAAKVCDLGCGDGVLTAELLKDNPNLAVTLMDGSAGMLDAARKRFSLQPSLAFVQKSFQALIEDARDFGEFDLVMSAFAIHHLELAEKRALFAAVFNHLRPGGYLLNIETVLSAHSEFTEWYYALWQEWIESRNKRLGLKD